MMTFKPSLEGREGASQAERQQPGEHSSLNGLGSSKGLKWESVWHIQRTKGRPLWLELSW